MEQHNYIYWEHWTKSSNVFTSDYHLERIDGATPMYWFIMATELGSGYSHLLSPQCIPEIPRMHNSDCISFRRSSPWYTNCRGKERLPGYLNTAKATGTSVINFPKFQIPKSYSKRRRVNDLWPFLEEVIFWLTLRKRIVGNLQPHWKSKRIRSWITNQKHSTTLGWRTTIWNCIDCYPPWKLT